MGPLQGFRIVEIAGIGPGPFCGMLLADMGADVIRIDRPGGTSADVDIPARFNILNRGRPSITADLKSDQGVRLVLGLCEKADALFEGFRPGVMEHLGLGPAECMSSNRRLVYGRVTGWGQDGPLAGTAGHDGNYASIAGALGAIGMRDGPPVVPLNLVADYGGGGVYLAIGILAALLEAQRSGTGQVVDAAMVDGAASLMTMFYGLRAGGLWVDERESNLLDGAAPFYRAYRTRDNHYVMVCAIEARFFRILLDGLQLDTIDPAAQHDRSKWADHIALFDEIFATRTRAEWSETFAGTDACVSPVLSIGEAPDHPHNVARGTFVESDGVRQPGPAPRFSRTRSEIRGTADIGPVTVGDILERWNLDDAGIDYE